MPRYLRPRPRHNRPSWLAAGTWWKGWACAGIVTCHIPRNEKGEPIPGKTLPGALLAFKPIAPMPVWAEKSSNIAGLPGWTDEQAVNFLMTGITYNELPGRPPMPQYRSNQLDAEAIVAYLRSLAPSEK
jgi:hypothetical protein